MNSAITARLRDARYRLPEQLGRVLPQGDVETAANTCARFARKGLSCSVGFFAGDDDPPATVAQTLCRLAEVLLATGNDAIIAIKAPQLRFDEGHVRDISSRGASLVFDAHAHHQVEAIHRLAAGVNAGVALPARWKRSLTDAQRLRDTPQRIRLVKGEWADPGGDQADFNAAYLQLVHLLAGRAAPVAIATHDPELAQASLSILRDAGTPAELEQLRGLPRRRTSAVARQLGVRVRLYHAFGPGWWPYALEQALRRPYLPLWAIRDMAGR